MIRASGTLYSKNSTIRMLGKQISASVFWQNNEARKAVDEIAEARPYSFTIEAASDIFVLGYIFGKRAERARKKARAGA
ncbi:MAG TPA: hypothetical protein DF613_11520 [Lachnospiraceae bacterium]|nr:hypothetical protein [Lachnospiraceae bacterium]